MDPKELSESILGERQVMPEEEGRVREDEHPELDRKASGKLRDSYIGRIERIEC